tara:strand:+ start:324 stop:929 length:606 start_codon:yes stop_codon:yes gene_type:complete
LKTSKLPSEALITFIRVPELGMVKTRLAVDLGDQRALEIYCSLLNHTQKISLELPCRRYLYYATKPIEDNWPTEHFCKKSQQGDDLGKRISNAFKEVCEVHNKVIIIGSDCPQLSSSLIQEAFDGLEENDVILGPTFDGGYYLLGMKSYYPFLFTDIEWSTNSVYSETVNKLEKHNLSFQKLEKLSDVDYAEDWEKFGWPL